MGRHRHALNVRADGLAAVLGRLLRDTRIRSAALVDVDSGMLRDACTADQARADLEVLGAGHAELVRLTLGVVPGPRGSLGRCDVVVDDGAGLHHVLRVIPEADGALLALSVVVAGPERVVARVRRRFAPGVRRRVDRRPVHRAATGGGPTGARAVIVHHPGPHRAVGRGTRRTRFARAPDGAALPVVAPPSSVPGATSRDPDARDADIRDADIRDAEARQVEAVPLPRRTRGVGDGPDAAGPVPDQDGEPPDVATLLFVKSGPGAGDIPDGTGPGDVEPAEARGRDGEEAVVPAALRMLPVSRLAAASRVVSASRAAREGVPLGAARAQAVPPVLSHRTPGPAMSLAAAGARSSPPGAGSAGPDGAGPDGAGPDGCAQQVPAARTVSDTGRRPAPPSALPPGPHRG